MLTKFIQQRLNTSAANNLLRNRWKINARNKNKIIINGKKLINFSSNDYLGITTDPKIKKTLAKAWEPATMTATY